jgi:SAM-dependent methyltransferase
LEVKNRYAEISKGEKSCCSDAATNCCDQIYDSQTIASIPEEADLGLGCGNPFVMASLLPGDVVLDLGSGAGVDVFIAAEKVGKAGKVIGVDMTPEMINKARQNKEQGDYPQVEFRLGEIEHLPVEDESVDVIISNCVINLSPKKEQVFRDAMRVLKPGGRLAVSDMVRVNEFPSEIINNTDYYTACVAGAITVSELEEILEQIGFENIQISPVGISDKSVDDWSKALTVEKNELKLSDYVRSASISASKPE